VRKRVYILLLVLSSITICWSIYRDVHIERGYTGDLRNRIVGARLQKDGHSPYFYKWKNGEGLRYYDPQNFDTLKVSNITASPFFHQLLYPLASLEQRTISKIWLFLEYFLLLVMTAIAVSLAGNPHQKVAVIITATIFLFTNAWTGQIATGQLYLIIPFLTFVFYRCITRDTKWGYATAAGICAAALILIRLNTVLFLLPFLLFFNRYSVKYKTFFFLSALVIFIFAFSNQQSILYWKDYRAALTEQLKSHQHLNPALQRNDPDPGYTNWEGWDMKQVASDANQFPYFYNAEHGNIFVLLNHSLHIKTPVWLLASLFFLFTLPVLYFFLKKFRRPSSVTLPYMAILAFCIYMASDILSPVHRFQYNATQWLFPLLLTASLYTPRHKWIYLGIIAGIILNSVNMPFMVMEQTLGEYLVFLSLLFFLLSHQPEATR